MLLSCFRCNVEASCHTLRRRLPPSTNSAAYHRLVSSTHHGPSQLNVFVRLLVCLSPKCKKRDFLIKTKQFRARCLLTLYICAFQTTHYWTNKIQDGGDPPSWMLTSKCKYAIFSKTKQLTAVASIDDL